MRAPSGAPVWWPKPTRCSTAPKRKRPRRSCTSGRPCANRCSSTAATSAVTWTPPGTGSSPFSRPNPGTVSPLILWPIVTGFSPGFQGFTWFHIALLGFTGCYRGFTRFYRASRSITWFQWVLPDFTRFFTGSYKVPPSITGFYRVFSNLT